MIYTLGTIIGALIAAFGLYYFVKERSSPESRKIYGAAALIGAAVAAAALVIGMLGG